MFSRLFKKESPVLVIEDNPLTVEQIHHEFLTAADNALAEANRIIGNTDEQQIKVANELAGLGFVKSKNVLSVTQLKESFENSKEQAKLILEVQQRYPLYKYISTDDVIRICRKYSLICGPVEKFTGEVPLKNVEEIKTFFEYFKKTQDYSEKSLKRIVINKITASSSASDEDEKKIKELINKIDRTLYTADGAYQHVIIRELVKSGQISEKLSERISGIEFDTEDVTLEICAPASDFDTQGMSLNQNFLVKGGHIKYEKAPIPDPVVLRRLHNKKGFLIATAWGPEASDPLVVNEKNN